MAQLYLEILSDYVLPERKQQIIEAYETQNWDNYRVGVNSLKSTSKTIGAMQLSEMALSLETAAKQNYGIDLKLFNDISVSFDYYIENRKQILIERGIIPAIQGREQNSLPKVNMGEVKNQGYELVLGYNKNIKKVGLYGFY